MYIVLVYNLNCARTKLNELLNNSGFRSVSTSAKGSTTVQFWSVLKVLMVLWWSYLLFCGSLVLHEENILSESSIVIKDFIRHWMVLDKFEYSFSVRLNWHEQTEVFEINPNFCVNGIQLKVLKKVDYKIDRASND